MDDLVLVDQDELAKQIETKAEEVIDKKLRETELKRLEKARAAIRKTQGKLTILNRQLPRAKISERRRIREEIESYENDLKTQQQDVDDINLRIEGDASPESERDYLVRTGQITAFGSKQGFTGGATTLKDHQNLHEPGVQQTGMAAKLPPKSVKSDAPQIKEEDESEVESDVDGSDYDPDEGDAQASEEEEFPVVINDDEDLDLSDTPAPASERNVDDGDDEVWKIRFHRWALLRRNLRPDQSTSLEQEPYLPHPSIEDAVLDDTFCLPGDIHPSLFDYQKTCVQWLWELYNQKTGGILGDEMGLGKTVQVISFLAGLHHSKILTKPVLVVVPATVLSQWSNEFHRWWPAFRVVILHGIGSGLTKKKLLEEEQMERMLESEENSILGRGSGAETTNAGELVTKVFDGDGPGVIITTYVGLGIYRRHLLGKQWGYCVLDEGHKIRNPNSIISLTCKQIKTYNRLILSGTPIQNNLKELWSLFDFIFPGRLGTLPVFEQQFSIPINMGGYANATNVQVQTGHKCAVVLRDLISPYLLRRVKADVARDLPKKQEMVVFVKLTTEQRELYHTFLNLEDLTSIMNGRRNVLYGVDILRKICNHPDLVHQHTTKKDYGVYEKSGKMVVLHSLLPQWQQQGHKTLLFCQTRQMLNILESFLQEMRRADGTPFNYLRMDGTTPIAIRQQLVDRFNLEPTMDLFLLTTKVGGLGVNLTGADRVIIYDPDWNPSTDIQARERAWRLGQTRDIVIYRLMTAGTIEEKIYHRQIFKTLLTNKILSDPKQKRFFKVNELHDLFTLGDDDEKGTETADIFNSRETQYAGSKARKLTKLTNKQGTDDILEVAGVSRLDDFEEKTGSQEPESDFFNLGVHSTVQHDDVLNSTEESTMAESEANKLAKQAVEALKQLSKVARKNKIGTPTWTGKFGALKGQFGTKKRGRDLSSLILSSLKRKREAADDDVEVVENPTLTKMVDFLRSQPDNFSPSKPVLDASGVAMLLKKELLTVRAMLKEVAQWDATAKGWRLKSLYL